MHLFINKGVRIICTSSLIKFIIWTFRPFHSLFLQISIQILRMPKPEILVLSPLCTISFPFSEVQFYLHNGIIVVFAAINHFPIHSKNRIIVWYYNQLNHFLTFKRASDKAKLKRIEQIILFITFIYLFIIQLQIIP